MTVPKFNCHTIAMALSLSALLISGAAQAAPDKDPAKDADNAAGSSASQRPAANNNKSGKGTKISEQQALNMVRARKEVADWLKLIKESKKKNPQTGQAVVEIDGYEGGNWRVHVYELMSDHTATMNWYNVDSKTGKITTDF